MNQILKKLNISKKMLKQLKLRRVEEIKQEAADLEESRVIENTERFKESLEIVDKIGKRIGEMRKWAPYCSEPSSYNPFPIDILKCNTQQLLQLLMHAYGTAEYLEDKITDLENKVMLAEKGYKPCSNE